ncbi:MAG: 5'-methylthioadenosine phosphorylase [Cycloclasticus sp. symbiont of Poecilosclerida sp. M]|nr:MAG: 5'-methylthioadenosine phosphorylase [Cycloclasticus sp. symbiont of Poecilosclerida sp. M]
MPALGIIGGTGLASLHGLENIRKQVIKTPYGEPSSPLTFGTLCGVEIVFLARHGYGHTIPPHKINYRANAWALQKVGVTQVVALAAVGGIHKSMAPTQLVIPDQLIDYSWGRVSSFFEDELDHVVHIDFTNPYSSNLRTQLCAAIEVAQLPLLDKAVYACTQGPRLETAAEIKKLERDGCDLVGMTGMPEAALACELKMEYACCAVVVNWAAGIDGDVIDMKDIEAHIEAGMRKVNKLLIALTRNRQALAVS